jgi:hypothetical protein
MENLTYETGVFKHLCTSKPFFNSRIPLCSQEVERLEKRAATVLLNFGPLTEDK